MCKCDYGQCGVTPGLGFTNKCSCRCHISSYTEEARVERTWWHEKLKRLKCVCTTKQHGNFCVRKAALRLVKERPL